MNIKLFIRLFGMYHSNYLKEGYYIRVAMGRKYDEDVPLYSEMDAFREAGLLSHSKYENVNNISSRTKVKLTDEGIAIIDMDEL